LIGATALNVGISFFDELVALVLQLPSLGFLVIFALALFMSNTCAQKFRIGEKVDVHTIRLFFITSLRGVSKECFAFFG